MSEVARQYNILAETLRKGIGGMQNWAIAQGAQRVEAKKVEVGMAQAERQYGLQEDQLDISRQRTTIARGQAETSAKSVKIAEDRLQFQKDQAVAATKTPKYLVEQQEAADKLQMAKDLQKPMSYDEFVEDASSMWPSLGKWADEQALPKIMEVLGWSQDKDGNLLDRDGTSVTRKDAHGPDVMAILAAEGRPKQMVVGMISDLDSKIEEVKGQGAKMDENELAPLVQQRKQAGEQLLDIKNNPVKYAQQEFNNTAAMLAESGLDDDTKKYYMKMAEANLEYAWKQEIATGTKAEKNKVLKPYYINEEVVGHAPIDKTVGTGAPPEGTAWGPKKGGPIDPSKKEFLRKRISDIDKSITKYRAGEGLSDIALAMIPSDRLAKLQESGNSDEAIEYLEELKTEYKALESLSSAYTMQAIYGIMKKEKISYDEFVDRVVHDYKRPHREENLY
jgi:hypothetical protein